MTLDELNALTTAAQKKAVTWFLATPDNPAIQISATETVDFVRIVNRHSLPAALSKLSLLQQNGLIRAAESQIGSHNAKVTNTNVGHPMYIDLKPGDTVFAGGVSPRTTRLSRTMGAAGNAADAGYMGFLCAACLLDGQAVTIAEDLSRKGGLYKACLQVGMDPSLADKLHDILARRYSCADDVTIDRFIKQIFVSRGQAGRYALVSPLQSEGLRAEVERRVRTRREQGQRFNTATTAVGGANAINAGRLNVEIGGRHTHFLCLPPEQAGIDSRSDWMNAQLLFLAGTGTVFRPRGLSTATIAAFKSTLRDRRQNRAAQNLYHNTLYHAATELIVPAQGLGDLLYEQDDCLLDQARFTKVPPYLKTWLDPRSGDARSDIDALALHIFERAIAVHPAFRDLPISGHLREAFIATCREIV
jgi:hypothetical protein